LSIFQIFDGCRSSAIALILGLLAIAACGCGQDYRNVRAEQKTRALDEAPSNEQTSDLITQLRIAKSINESNALDSDISAVRRADFTLQAMKADRAIRELQHGFTVPDSEAQDALQIPPKHLTPGQRTQLIEKLQQAQQLDDRREQEILIYLSDDEPDERSEFELQEQRAAAVAKDLQIGDSVPWSEVQQALYVPADPL